MLGLLMALDLVKFLRVDDFEKESNLSEPL